MRASGDEERVLALSFAGRGEIRGSGNRSSRLPLVVCLIIGLERVEDFVHDDDLAS